MYITDNVLIIDLGLPVTVLNSLVVWSIDEVATICLSWQISTATISPECPYIVHKHSPPSSSDHIRAVLSKDPVNTLENYNLIISTSPV